MKKKKNKMIKKIIAIFIIFFLIIVGSISLKIISLMKLDYTLWESITVCSSGLSSKVLNKGYSSSIVKFISRGEYIDKYFDSYFYIDYYDREDFVSFVNRLLYLGYKTDEINVINKKNDEMLNNYLEVVYVKDITKWLSYSYFKSDLIERYLAYFNGDYNRTILDVNIGLDKENYTDVESVKDFSITMLVNKHNKLDNDFVPPDLVLLDNCTDGEQYLSKEAKEAYDDMCMASREAGMNLSVTSSFRDYQSQEDTFNYYLNLYGQDYVDNYVAKAGFSEHQTALALDVKSSVASPFRTTKEYEWMIENSYKYGFILRYPKGREKVTGCNNEEWHFRYVGKEIAEYIKENDITFDEYYVMFLDN